MHQFVTEPAVAARGLTNYWGYNSIGFFAPHAAYSSSGDRGEQVTEFKAMVKAFHDAGLEVILDVVYNHTAEAGVDRADPELPRAGRQDLPPGAAGAVGQRSPEPELARHLLGRDRLRQHRRRQPPVRAADDPRLAALLGDRDARRRLPVRPALRAHPDRPARRHAQPPAGRHRPGPGAAAREADRRAVGRVGRRLPRGRVPAAVDRVERPVPRRDPRLLERAILRASASVATRLAGSSDLYADDGRSPYASVNFVTAHDGFTVRDLVSYDAQAQRGQRRGQPGRQRQQPVVQPRRRGRDDRRAGSSPCAAARPRT